MLNNFCYHLYPGIKDFNKLRLVMIVHVRDIQRKNTFFHVLLRESFTKYCPMLLFHHNNKISPCNFIFSYRVFIVKACRPGFKSIFKQLFCCFASVFVLTADEKDFHVVSYCAGEYKFCYRESKGLASARLLLRLSLLSLEPRNWLRSVDTQYGACSSVTRQSCHETEPRYATLCRMTFDQTLLKFGGHPPQLFRYLIRRASRIDANPFEGGHHVP